MVLIKLKLILAKILKNGFTSKGGDLMSAVLKIDASVMTNKGNTRSKNEDNFYFNGVYMDRNSVDNSFCFSTNLSGNQFVFAVCDGMGGEHFGEEASFLAVQSLHEFYKSTLHYSDTMEDLKDNMDTYVKKANRLVYEQSISLGKKMGTTLASIIFCKDKAMALNIGDSRVYLLQNSNLTKLTTDHTEAQRLIRLGVLNENSAKLHRSKNILTRHLGIDPANGIMEADFSDELTVLKGDTYLVCSDGLSTPLTNEEIKFHLSIDSNSSSICKDLIDLALNNTETDNITALVVRVVDLLK